MSEVIALTEDMVRVSRELDSVVRRRLKQTPNYTKLIVKDRFFTGYLGEFVALEWFKKAGLHGRHDVKATGNSEASEFVINREDGTEVSVEVKTSGSVSYRLCMMPEAQRLDFDVLVGVRIDLPKNRAEVFGWDWVHEVRKWPLKVFPPHGIVTRYQALDLLRPMSTFATQALAPKVPRETTEGVQS